MHGATIIAEGKRHTFVALLLLTLALVPAHRLFAYEVVEVANGGTLAGTVRLAGDPPKLAPIAIRKNQEFCGNSVPSETLILGKDKGVKNTVVWIEGITKGKPITAMDVGVDNKACRFVPHVAAATVSGKSEVVNSDPILHNTHAFRSGQTVFNLALPLENQVIDVTRRVKRLAQKKNLGVVDIRCDAHVHMQGWLVLRPDPYFAVTDDDGRFRIGDIPPGTYKAVAWHESWDVKGADEDGRLNYGPPVVIEKEISIPPGGEATLAFELGGP